MMHVPLRYVIAALALTAPACVQILGADQHYYTVDAGTGGSPESTSSSAGGSGGTPTSTTSTSTTTSSTGGSFPCGTPVTAPDGPCGAGTIGMLQDNFDDNMTGMLWATYAIPATEISVAEQNQGVFINAAGKANTFAGYVSQSLYALASCQASIEVKTAPAGADASTHFSFSPDPSTQKDVLEINVRNGQLFLRKVVSGVETSHGIPYDPVCHRFWRFREASGIIYSEASPDGHTWVELGHDASPTTVSGGKIDFGVYVFTDTAQPLTALFDNFNVAP